MTPQDYIKLNRAKCLFVSQFVKFKFIELLTQLKMPQSGVGSMQGSNKDCLPMKGHTRGDTPTVLPIERTHRGGDAPTM